MKSFRQVVAYSLAFAGLAVIVVSRIRGFHMTEGENLVAYWPQYLMGAALLVAAFGVAYWSEK